MPGESHGFDAWEWENKFQLIETGKYPVDIGLLLEGTFPYVAGGVSSWVNQISMGSCSTQPGWG